MGAARLVVGNICRLGVPPEKLERKHLIAEIGRHCTELLDHHGELHHIKNRPVLQEKNKTERKAGS